MFQQTAKFQQAVHLAANPFILARKITAEQFRPRPIKKDSNATERKSTAHLNR
jgi:hypothetical protein